MRTVYLLMVMLAGHTPPHPAGEPSNHFNSPTVCRSLADALNATVGYLDPDKYYWDCKQEEEPTAAADPDDQLPRHMMMVIKGQRDPVIDEENPKLFRERDLCEAVAMKLNAEHYAERDKYYRFCKPQAEPAKVDAAPSTKEQGR